jgi:hypothetical protein
MLFKEITAVYCENHTEHINTLCVKVKVTLRLTVSQSVSLGIEHPPGAHDHFFFPPI